MVDVMKLKWNQVHNLQLFLVGAGSREVTYSLQKFYMAKVLQSLVVHIFVFGWGKYWVLFKSTKPVAFSPVLKCIFFRSLIVFLWSSDTVLEENVCGCTFLWKLDVLRKIKGFQKPSLSNSLNIITLVLPFPFPDIQVLWNFKGLACFQLLFWTTCCSSA